VALIETLSKRVSDRQAKYLATASSINLEDALTRSRIASEDGRADALGRLARFDQAIAEFASSQDEDMSWVAGQLAGWNVPPDVSSKIVAGIDRGRQKNVPTLARWLAIQHERASVMRELVDLSEKQVVGLESDGETLTFKRPDDANSYSALRNRLAKLASEEDQLGRGQSENNQQVRERLSR
jgi:hypothetical protein